MRFKSEIYAASFSGGVPCDISIEMMALALDLDLTVRLQSRHSRQPSMEMVGRKLGFQCECHHAWRP